MIVGENQRKLQKCGHKDQKTGSFQIFDSLTKETFLSVLQLTYLFLCYSISFEFSFIDFEETFTNVTP